MVPMLALIVMVVDIQARLYSQHSCGMQSYAGCTLQQGTFHGPLLALSVMAFHIQAKLYLQHCCGMQSYAGCI